MLTKPRGEQTSKTLNYLDASFVGPYFGLFMCVWIYLRHYLNLRILYSLFTEFKTIGPYELDWEGGQYKCWISFYITLVLLASLQALNLFWLFFIVRIAYRFVVYQTADDDRSEAEESEVEDRDSAGAAAAEKKKRDAEKAPLLNGGSADAAATPSPNKGSNGASSKSKAR